MKKLLSILTAGAIVGTAVPSITAASSYAPKKYAKSVKITDPASGTTTIVEKYYIVEKAYEKTTTITNPNQIVAQNEEPVSEDLDLDMKAEVFENVDNSQQNEGMVEEECFLNESQDGECLAPAKMLKMSQVSFIKPMKRMTSLSFKKNMNPNKLRTSIQSKHKTFAKMMRVPSLKTMKNMK